MYDQKNPYFYGAVAVGVVLVLALCWFLLTDIHGNSRPAIDAGARIERASSEQRRIDANIERIGHGLDASARGVAEIESRLGDAETALDSVERGGRDGARILADSERRIETCLGIIEEIRARPGAR